MPVHRERRILPYSAEKLFQLVADVERYPEFLPWVAHAQIIEATPERMIADLDIGYKFLTDSYRSEVTLKEPIAIDVACIQGPFHHLTNQWRFEDQGDGTTAVDFFIDFEFKSSLMQGLMNTMFQEAVHRMMTAFEERAKNIHLIS